MFMDGVAQALTPDALKAFGVNAVIDDFGTGFRSAVLLTPLPDRQD